MKHYYIFAFFMMSAQKVYGVTEKEFRTQMLALEQRQADAQERQAAALERANVLMGQRMHLERKKLSQRELKILLEYWPLYIESGERDDLTQVCYAAVIANRLHALLLKRLPKLPQDQRAALAGLCRMTPESERDHTEWDDESRRDACTGFIDQLLSETVDQALGEAPEDPAD